MDLFIWGNKIDNLYVWKVLVYMEVENCLVYDKIFVFNFSIFCIRILFIDMVFNGMCIFCLFVVMSNLRFWEVWL